MTLDSFISSIYSDTKVFEALRNEGLVLQNNYQLEKSIILKILLKNGGFLELNLDLPLEETKNVLIEERG